MQRAGCEFNCCEETGLCGGGTSTAHCCPKGFSCSGTEVKTRNPCCLKTDSSDTNADYALKTTPLRSLSKSSSVSTQECCPKGRGKDKEGEPCGLGGKNCRDQSVFWRNTAIFVSVIFVCTGVLVVVWRLWDRIAAFLCRCVRGQRGGLPDNRGVAGEGHGSESDRPGGRGQSISDVSTATESDVRKEYPLNLKAVGQEPRSNVSAPDTSGMLEGDAVTVRSAGAAPRSASSSSSSSSSAGPSLLEQASSSAQTSNLLARHPNPEGGEVEERREGQPHTTMTTTKKVTTSSTTTTVR
uniref:Uncharacterized protein n=1 Tax=Chromera velia CCMP2878 TaxID=1169474 RepID=A0A0G4GSD7_9ALVE|eukprot:Cvel_5140.t1-p1 / transcript=Cvel_5140.t1 / gene=Cvel_5140 / organism=Chromera_velia_CCMP2878 / gene_product=hypothetical protein / transcript_product=hypothetical protein / location=Cvel_scaffold235:57600-58487(+) / protein_length=296 / sequence_SO=supercontig / SO=protein_coding / is_pseudo=false